jgi:hypothetical protein
MKRGKGRPPKTKHDYWGQVLWLERLAEEETATMRKGGAKPTKALARAAFLLGISKRSAFRLMAQAREKTTIDWSEQPLGELLRQLQRDLAKKINGTDFLAPLSCSAD